MTPPYAPLGDPEFMPLPPKGDTPMATQFRLTDDQAAVLGDMLVAKPIGSDVLLTWQGDGSVVVATSERTVEITTAGTVFEDESSDGPDFEPSPDPNWMNP